MKFVKHGKKHEAKESAKVERREDSNKAYKAAEAKMKMIETAMHGKKAGIRESRNFRRK